MVNRNNINEIKETDKYITLKYYDEINGDAISSNILHLSLDEYFGDYNSYSVNNLPKSIIKLNLDYDFYNIIDNLPCNLLCLNFGDIFNLKINNLPKTIIHLSLGDIFNKKINSLPYHLNRIYLSGYFKKNINNLPINLRKLILIENYNNIINNLPCINELSTSILFNKNMNNMPYSLEKIFYDIECNNLVHKLPSFLKILEFHEEFNKNINNLMKKLEKLDLGVEFNQHINNLPNITYIYLDRYFNKSIMNLPHSLIEMSYDCEKQITYLPYFIKILSICSNYNYLLDLLPEGIEILKLYGYTKQINDLPLSIKEIWITNSEINKINPIYYNKVKIR